VILALAFLYTPVPPVPFPDEFQGAWDQNAYACSQAATATRLAISKSHFMTGEYQGYSTGFNRLNETVIIADMVGGRSNAKRPSLQRLELSEDGDMLFVQSFPKSGHKGTVTAQFLVRCADQETAMEASS